MWGRSLFAMLVFLCAGAAAQDKDCAQGRVTYVAKDELGLNRRIKIEKVDAPRELPAAYTGKEVTVQSTRWFAVAEPDFQKTAPWNTTVLIGDVDEAATTKITVADHGSGGVKLVWINEKLLFGQVWWGRIVSTDFVYDVEQNRMVYKELANYGELVECRERPAKKKDQ
jgi:hypothetical protein